MIKYKLKLHPGSLLHQASQYWLINDVDEPIERELLKAKIRSGDYLADLATNLDEISQMILEGNEQQSVMLQRAVEDLLYLERTHRLVPKQTKNNEVAFN